MKIIKHGINIAKQRCFCPKCGCEFELDGNELTHAILSFLGKPKYVIGCPECDYGLVPVSK
jgi:hypothetical protein